MSISPFFLDLRSAYQSEMDDLRFDSEGRDVLHQRLGEKRREIGFLVQMMELSPEMVAVVFHQAFDFTGRAVMDQLLRHDTGVFPAWSSLAGGLALRPWAQDLAHIVLQAPGGDRFLTLTAGLEYMAGLPADAVAPQDNDEDEDEDMDQDDDESGLVRMEDDGDSDEGGDDRARREAGAAWLVEQGFDQKD